MADDARGSFEARALEVLKAVGKTLSQINLYSSQHPAVKRLLGETADLLASLLSEAPGGELAYSIDGEKLIANGKVVGSLMQLPNSIPNAFQRFKLHSITLRSGVAADELAAFCELAALRPDQARGVVPSEFLAAKGVAHLSLNEAVYAKVEKGGEPGGEGQGTPGPGSGGGPAAPGAPVAPGGAAGSGGAEALIQAAADQPLERVISELVSRAVADPADRARLMDAVLRRVRQDLEKKILEATVDIRRAKQTVENESARTQGVIESIAQGVVIVDDQGKVLMMNPEAESLFGSRLSELAGKPVKSAAKEEHMVALAADFAVPADRAIEKKAEVQAGDDTRRTLRASTAVIQDEGGKTVGMVSALSDKAKMRELERVEREFIAHVTHELRAPLTSIRAALEIVEGMLSGRLNDEADRMFRNALRNTDRLEALINSILDFSKIESGQMSVLPERASAAAVAGEAVESMKPWTTKKGLRLELVDRSAGADVAADVPRIVQVLVNLLSNAIKFTPAGGAITVNVSPAPDAAPKAVLFSVKDSGPGIAKDQQERVFEKFVQIAEGQRHVGGTGLGLAIAKALVVLHKGTMWIESEPGRGADFRFTLPVFVGESDAPAAQAKSAAAPKSWWQRLLGL